MTTTQGLLLLLLVLLIFSGGVIIALIKVNKQMHIEFLNLEDVQRLTDVALRRKEKEAEDYRSLYHTVHAMVGNSEYIRENIEELVEKKCEEEIKTRRHIRLPEIKQKANKVNHG